MSLGNGKKPKRTALNLAPFGEADGQRSELADDFVSFEIREGWGGISTGEDSAARLLVGRKGSGKTVYLRRLRANAGRDTANFADEVHYQPPDTETVLSFARFFSSEAQLEWWAKLWNRCILRSVASHFMVGELSQAMLPRNRDKLEEFTRSERGKLLRDFAAPVSIYRQMDEIVNGHHARNSLVDYLQNPAWSDLESILTDALRGAPPIFMFLDALDEHFERAPRWWLKCQEGLFFQAVQFLRSPTWNRLHLGISLRDIVYASMMRSEHRSRFTSDSRIRLLNWHYRSIETLLAAKLQRLERDFFVGDPRGTRTLRAWLGIETVHNRRRGVQEPVVQYLLRHTRLLPRDIIILGNRLCATIARGRRDGLEIEDEVRRQVHETASVFGREQFRICANDIASGCMPKFCANSLDQFGGSDDFTSAIAAELQELVRMIGVDRFGRDVLDRFDEGARERFDCDVFSLMWRNGLVGYVDDSEQEERFIFYDYDSLNSFSLPIEAREYVFHPIVIDATGIPSRDNRPVVPYF
jgi:hypothetical protein